MKLKQGTIREDGMVFWQYYSSGKERWVTSEKYNEIYSKRREQKKVRYWEKLKENKAYSKAYRESNKDSINQKIKLWRTKNPQRCRELQIEWRKNNKDRFMESRRIYMSQKRNTDPLFKLRCNISTLIQNGLRNGGFSKDCKTAEILGCGFEFFKKHIEQNFKKRMSWENRDEWHLDHIIPISSAKTKEEIIALNHYTNFQPLWADENRRKGNKI